MTVVQCAEPVPRGKTYDIKPLNPPEPAPELALGSAAWEEAEDEAAGEASALAETAEAGVMAADGVG